MTFRILDALPMLVLAYGETINKVVRGERTGLENKKVMGFRTRSGRLLALHVEPKAGVWMWFDAAHKVASPDIEVKAIAPDNHDLSGALACFRNHRATYAEFKTSDALANFVANYR